MPASRKGLFITGAILIIIGAGISTFATFFLLFYGIPLFVFIAGVVLIWLSRRKAITKLLWTAVPICIFFAFQFIWYKSHQVTPETFLIPADYRGAVHVIFNEPCGSEPTMEHGKRVYQIPSNGILITKFKAEYGFINQQYFFVTSDGKRIAVSQMDTRDFNEEWTLEKHLHEPSRDSLGVFNPAESGTGIVHGEKEFVYQAFHICTYRQLNDSFGFIYERRFDSAEQALLKQCRSKK